MENIPDPETIVAPLTAIGGAVAAIRLSGPQALSIAQQLAPTPFTRRSHQLYQARLQDHRQQILDEAMVVEMHEPASYTGEDVVELYLHGSAAVVRAVLQACFALGARLAEPGEFTARAVENGKMDALQAEGVGALVRAETEEERVAALRQLGGELSGAVQQLYDTLLALTSRLQGQLDFPDGVGEPEDLTALAQGGPLWDLRSQIAGLLQHRRTMAEGLPLVVLSGMSNAGKSSLLNRWLGQQRVLVHEQPGTTRDAVEITYYGEQCTYRLMDTAGLRYQHLASKLGGVEQQGIALGQRFARQAQWVLWLINPEEVDNQEAWPPLGMDREHLAVVASQIDRSPSHLDRVRTLCQERGWIFAGGSQAGAGPELLALRRFVEQQLMQQQHEATGSMLLSVRQEQMLLQLRQLIDGALEQISQGGTLDMVLMHLQDATTCLARLLGREGQREVFEQIFGQFCLGK